MTATTSMDWMEALTTPTRVLIENGNARARTAQAELLRDRGFVVFECGGPDPLGDGCPLLQGEVCDLVEGADLVLHDLDLDDPQHASVFDQLRARYPDLPVVLELQTSKIRRHANRLAGCTVIAPFDADHLVHAIEDAASHAGQAQPAG